MRRRFAPPVRPTRAPPRFRSGERAETRDELAIGERLRRLAGNVTMASVVPVALEHVSIQPLMHRPRTDDEQVVLRGQPIGDFHDKSLEVLEAVRLAGTLWAAAAAVPHGGIVPDVAGGPVVSRYLRFDPFESSPVVLPADDDGLP